MYFQLYYNYIDFIVVYVVDYAVMSRYVSGVSDIAASYHRFRMSYAMTRVFGYRFYYLFQFLEKNRFDFFHFAMTLTTVSSNLIVYITES